MEGLTLKRLFFIAVGIIITAALSLVAYGAFLNYKSEKVISNRMAIQVINLEGIKVHKKTITPTWNRSSIRLSAEKMTDAISRLEGTIEEIYVQKNDKVKKNQPLCKIVNEDLGIKLAQIDVSIAKTEAIKIRYQHTYERYKKLIDIGAIAKEQFEEAETNFKSAAEEVRQLKLERQQYEIQQDRLTIKAPFDGEILMLYKTPGSFITAGTSIALIGNFNALTFTEVLSDDEVNSLGDLDAKGLLEFNQENLDKIFGTSYNKGNLGKMQKFETKIISIDPPVAIPAAMRKVTWGIDNTSGLLEPKRYTDVQILSMHQLNTLVVPDEAFTDSTKKTVYVWNQATSRLELRQVQPGFSDNGYTEIRTGLNEGEIVIISSKKGLQNGIKANVTIKGDVSDAK